MIETVLNVADPRLHFAVKECATVDNTKHLADDLACLKMAPRSRVVMQQRAETLDDALIRELLELRAETSTQDQ